jgi:pimeloyl-ACP methyl ester carboxylesterase
MTKPHIVLVPGAWHTPTSFTPLTTALRALGYTIHSAQLASVGATTPPSDLSADIAIVRSLVETAIASGQGGNDVVVIAHSWGGIVAGSALVGLGKEEREGQGEGKSLRGGVVRTGYIAAYILDEGICLQDAIEHHVPSWVDVQDPFVYALDAEPFYSDLQPEEREEWFKDIKSQGLASFYAKCTGASWKRIPSCYLLAEEDECVPPVVQERMVKEVKDKGAEIEVVRWKCGHSPWLSRREETVMWVRRVAGEEV